MAGTIGTVVEDDAADPADLVTRREVAVLAVALSVVVGGILLLVLMGQEVAGALVGPA